MAGDPIQTAAPIAQAGVAMAPPPLSAEVVLSGEGPDATCVISDEGLASIRQRAYWLLRAAGEKGYGHFPIDRKRLAQRTAATMLTRDTICHALTTPSGATETTHDKLREEYKADTLRPEDAHKRGVHAARIPLIVSCPEGYDWAGSDEYNDADECSDITKTFGKGIATAMYATRMLSDDAMTFLNEPTTAPYYTRYVNDGPIACGEGDGFHDSYHRIPVCGICADLELVIRSFTGDGWSAWTSCDSCTAPGGETYTPDDLMFDNGVRVFIPLDVVVDGQSVDRTIVVSQVAAASTSVWAFAIPKDLPFHRFVGGEVAKKLVLEARERGWEMKKEE